jgi:very-short-patch-repair endonuclease
MRQNPTPSEARLRRQLRGKQLGVAFRRQVVVGRFIVDFLSPEGRLVVEVDGGVHAGRRSRDEALAGMGDRVVRVAADEVMWDATGVAGRL